MSKDMNDLAAWMWVLSEQAGIAPVRVYSLASLVRSPAKLRPDSSSRRAGTQNDFLDDAHMGAPPHAPVGDASRKTTSCSRRPFACSVLSGTVNRAKE